MIVTDWSGSALLPAAGEVPTTDPLATTSSNDCFVVTLWNPALRRAALAVSNGSPATFGIAE